MPLDRARWHFCSTNLQHPLALLQPAGSSAAPGLALLTSYYEGVLGMAGASGVTAPRALALSCTPQKLHTPADPPPADPADEPAPAPAGSAGAQEPAPAASPPKAGGKGGVRARGCGEKILLCLMNAVPWCAELKQQCNFWLNFICA